MKPGFFGVLVACVVFSAVAAGQSNTKASKNRGSPATTGKLHGRVFAITLGGDLKPARMAKVDIIRENTPLEVVIAGVLERYNAELEKVREEFVQERLKKSREGSEYVPPIIDEDTRVNLLCRKTDFVIAELVLVAVRADTQLPATSRTFVETIKADEEGFFTVSAKPGTYSLLISGRAGSNDALWLLKDVNVKARETTEVKVSSPVHACGS
jgi:hypothetical protein